MEILEWSAQSESIKLLSNTYDDETVVFKVFSVLSTLRVECVFQTVVLLLGSQSQCV